jgi:hypothetical protein
MASLDHSQLSALGATVDDLVDRIVTLADRLGGSGESEAAASLIETERSLRMAGRSLDRARRSLRD